MRFKIYTALVNRVPGICYRYHNVHDGASGIKQLLSWLYLIWLNFAYYILKFKWLEVTNASKTYENKKLSIELPESALFKHKSTEEMLEMLSSFDVISFDIFDTLIFRPFSAPTDLFYIIGQKLGYMDFKRIRIECEKTARQKKFENEGNYEVNITDIWAEVELQTGINAEKGIDAEISTELELCYPNEYMSQIYKVLLESGKHIVITSDMYLPSDILQKLLDKCGYNGYERLYVSCDEGRSKGNGELFKQMISDQQNNYGMNVRIIHIGDNANSDYTQAKKLGLHAYKYSNVNTNSKKYRTYDISPIVGSAYRGIVNNRIYSGNSILSLNKEYGFIYGGLFILGYCNFIHEYCKHNSIEKVLFLSRDGAIIKKAFDYIFHDCDTEYVYISRLAAAKWCAKDMKSDFFRKMIRHKVGSGKNISTVLHEMELDKLTYGLNNYNLLPEELLTIKNKDVFEAFINNNWEQILNIYMSESELAKAYYNKVIDNAKNAVAVDIGWAGSGYIALNTLFKNEWKIDCKLTGIIAGTNTVYSTEPDISETFLLDGSLVSYLFSARANRDILKKHNPNSNYNLYFELLTSSCEPSFRGFKMENGLIKPVFGKPEANTAGITEIWEGIMTFVKDYTDHFSNHPYMFNISGRDAYAPMLLAECRNEKYLKAVYKEFNLTVGVE